MKLRKILAELDTFAITPAQLERPIGPNGVSTAPTGVPKDDTELSPDQEAQKRGWTHIGMGRYVDDDDILVARVVGDQLLIL